MIIWKNVLSRRSSLANSIQHLARETTEDAKVSFHESVPPTLLAQKCSNEKDCIPPFKWTECRIGPKLGEGEFSFVYEVESFRLKDDDFQSIVLRDEELGQRLHMKKREKYHGTKQARYAVKLIKPSRLESREGKMEYVQDVRDLATEAEFLSSLTHPHIIKLRGLAHYAPTGFALIMDRLVETLDQRIRSWHNPTKTKRASVRNLRRSATGLAASFLEAKSEGKGLSHLRRCMTDITGSFTKAKLDIEVNGNDDVMDERLTIAFQIAAAMKYLHSNRIMFRDLKPTNIGFDVRGDVKIFDFGLARFCPNEGDPNMDTYAMSGAGSPRYMAPECLSGAAYNMKADIYSYSIVLWEILSGKTPYLFIRRKHVLINFVVKENGRPDIDDCWPTAIQVMMGHCFSRDIDSRPEMARVYDTIKETLLYVRDGDDNKLDDKWVSRRRSIASVE